MTIDPHPTIGPRLGGEDCGGPFGRGRSDDGGMALVLRSTVPTIPALSTLPSPRHRGLLQSNVGEGTGLEGEAAPPNVTPRGDGARFPAAWPRLGRRSPGAATSRPSATSCPAAAGAGRQLRVPARPLRGSWAPPPPWHGRRPLHGCRGLPYSLGPRPLSGIASRKAASSCVSSGPSPPPRRATSLEDGPLSGGVRARASGRSPSDVFLGGLAAAASPPATPGGDGPSPPPCR